MSFFCLPENTSQTLKHDCDSNMVCGWFCLVSERESNPNWQEDKHDICSDVTFPEPYYNDCDHYTDIFRAFAIVMV